MTDHSQLIDLAAELGCTISPDRAALLLAYLDAMLEENQKVNLTAVRDREAAVMFHALDALALGCAPLELGSERCLDLGTGNGFPGVAIACLFPEARVLLMDRTLKKLKAIERAVERAGFEPRQIETVQMDASEGPAHGYEAAFHLITARAVAAPAEIGKLAKPLLARNGQLLCWLAEESDVPAQLPGDLRVNGEVVYRLPAPANRNRRLVSYSRPARK